MSDDKLIEFEEMSKSVLKKIDWIVSSRHLSLLSKAPILPYLNLSPEETETSSCLFPVRRIVYDKQENSLEKMMSMYIGAASISANPVLMINHPNSGGKAELYIGVCDEKNASSASMKADIFHRNLLGNFPGCQTTYIKDETQFLSQEDMNTVLKTCFLPCYYSVSSVSGIASGRLDLKKENASFIQGIERMLDGMEDQSYSVIILANHISNEEISDMLAEYENIYNQLYPYLKTSYSLNSSNASSTSKTFSDSLSEMINKSVSKTLSVGSNSSSSKSKGGNRDITTGVDVGVGVSGGITIPGAVSEKITIPGAYIGGGLNVSSSHSDTRGTNWNDTFTKGISKSESDGESKTTGKTTTVSFSEGGTYTITEGQSVQIFQENKIVQGLLASLEQKIKRFRDGRALGMFAVSAYFIAADSQTSKAAASIYKATITGNNTSMEDVVINTWKGNQYEQLKPYLQKFQHPQFILDDNVKVTPASIVTSAELAIQMGLPKSSIMGVPVSESISFGRSITMLDSAGISEQTSDDSNYIEIGKMFHLGKSGKTRASLGVQSLTMHTFITGTTGSGKSNTVYLILDRLLELPSNVHFMVIEPAKGEYKSIFGQCEKLKELGKDVYVYGTNPKLTPLLRINPFAFHSEIHVLEHIDRLVSIFNVCWPMEAAMPAILKQAIERAYTKAGWNLKFSYNIYHREFYPTFYDVMQEVEQILNESEYSGDNKGDYKGALCTRLKELTTGLNNLIFCSNELSDEELFNKNVIVDLSRLSSEETKSLIMGILVIRLQEYRQSTYQCINAPLQHVTVLEEAHHLLKRTSKQQSVDNANILGKSVEMLSNALAELRSYGEGFIIADQSPEQVDMSAVRNTNTKIILRLPVYEDRKVVGKAVGLNDNQIAELAKLPTGIAAVYQNNWLDTVLVNVDRFKTEQKIYKKQDSSLQEDEDTTILWEIIVHPEKRNDFCQKLRTDDSYNIDKWNISVELKKILWKLIQEDDVEEVEVFSELAFEFFQMKSIMKEFLEEIEYIEYVDINENDIKQEQVTHLWEIHLSEKLVPAGKNVCMEDKYYLFLELTRKCIDYYSLFETLCFGMQKKLESFIIDS